MNGLENLKKNIGNVLNRKVDESGYAGEGATYENLELRNYLRSLSKTDMQAFLDSKIELFYKKAF